MQLRPIELGDWPAVLALNAASVDLVSPMDAGALEWFVEHAHRALVVDDDGQVAAFTIVLEPGTSYESPNYRWFSERYQRFLYLDRIAVGERWRRQGVGTLIYVAMEELASSAQFGRLLCEVDLDPPNAPSLAFHTARGYVEVGQVVNLRGKLLVMLAKELEPADHGTSGTAG